MTTMISSTPNSNDTIILGTSLCDTININPPGAYGISPGSIYTLSSSSGGGNTFSSSNIGINGNRSRPNTDVVITDKNGTTVSVLDMNDRIKQIEERILLINNIEKHKEYPALKKAYEQYKLIDAICQREPNNEETK